MRMAGRYHHDYVIYGPRRKTCLRGFANNTGADQPAHLHRLISAFVILFLESFISKLATKEISVFWLVSVAKETGFSLALLETSKTGFIVTRLISFLIFQGKYDFKVNILFFIFWQAIYMKY